MAKDENDSTEDGRELSPTTTIMPKQPDSKDGGKLTPNFHRRVRKLRVSQMFLLAALRKQG